MNGQCKNYFIDILLMILATCPVLYSLCLDLYVAEERQFWFQRSGSLMVLFAVLLELNALKHKEAKGSNNTFVNGKPIAIAETLPTFKKTTQIAGFILAIIGTVIWGYGDLPFKT